MMAIQRHHGALLGYVLVIIGLLRLYFQKPAFHDQVDFWNEYFQRGAVVVHEYLPPVHILLFGGCTVTCLNYRKAVKGRKSWLEVLLACCMMQFGGTTLAGLLLGQPPSWLLSKAAFPAMFVSWWLVFFCPGDAFWRALQPGSPLLLLAEVMKAVCSVHATSSWGTDKAFANTFHTSADTFRGSWQVCILSGMLSAGGGGLLGEMFGMLRPANAFVANTTPGVLQIGNYKSSAALIKAFWSAVLHYCLIAYAGQTLVTGHSVLVIIHLVLFVQSKLLPEVDFYQELSNVVLALLWVQPVIDLGGEPAVKPHSA